MQLSPYKDSICIFKVQVMFFSQLQSNNKALYNVCTWKTLFTGNLVAGFEYEQEVLVIKI